MVGPVGLLLVVPTYMQFQFFWVGLQNEEEAKLRHLILLSRMTYWAQMELLL
jgi:hypothetical protein